MRFPRVSTVALVALLVALCTGSAVVAASAAAAPSMSEGESTEPLFLETSQDGVSGNFSFEPAEPAQIIHVNVTDTGDAVWTFESRSLLEDEDDEAAFMDFAQAVAAGERDAGYDPTVYADFVDAAADGTDRNMSVSNEGYIDPRIETLDTDPEMGIEGDNDTEKTVGTIAYQFTWEGFATVDGSNIFIGDAFYTAAGDTWFPDLSGDQRFIIEIPPNYGFDTSPPVGAQDRSLVWNGPYEFDDGERDIVLLRGADDTPPGNGDDTGPGEQVESDLPIVGIALAVIGFVGALLILTLLSRAQPAWLPAPLGGTENDSSSADSPDEGPTLERGDDGDGAPVTPSGEPLENEEIDPELLSDEERVLRMLRSNGGRMKQANIVKETGWSNAKVSQLLSKMAEDDDVEKLRIGRENLITLPEVDPTEVE